MFIFQRWPKMPKKGKTMSWGDFQQEQEKLRNAARAIDQANEKKKQDEAAEKKKISDEKKKQKEQGFEIAILRDYMTPPPELPLGVQVVAFEFAVLALLNLDFSSCKTVAEFKFLFEPFYRNYITAPNNFEIYFKSGLITLSTLEAWVQTYAVSRKDEKCKSISKDQCWRFLLYVSVDSCLKALQQVLNWVTISPTNILIWNITPDFLKTYRLPMYVWNGYYKHERAKEFKKSQQRKELDERVKAAMKDEWDIDHNSFLY